MMLALWILLGVVGYVAVGAFSLVAFIKAFQAIAPTSDITDFLEDTIEEAGLFALWVIWWPLFILVGILGLPIISIYRLAIAAYEWEPKPKVKKGPKAVGSKVEPYLIMQLERDTEMRGTKCYCDDAHLNEFCPSPLTYEQIKQIKWRKELEGYQRINASRRR